MEFSDFKNRFQPVLEAAQPAQKISDAVRRRALLDGLAGLQDAPDRRTFLEKLMELEARNREVVQKRVAGMASRATALFDHYAEGQQDVIREVLDQVRSVVLGRVDVQPYADALARGLAECISSGSDEEFRAARQATLRDAMTVGMEETRKASEGSATMLLDTERHFEATRADADAEDWPFLSAMLCITVAVSSLALIQSKAEIGIQDETQAAAFEKAMSEVPVHLLDGIIRDSIQEMVAAFGLEGEAPSL